MHDFLISLPKGWMRCPKFCNQLDRQEFDIFGPQKALTGMGTGAVAKHFSFHCQTLIGKHWLTPDCIVSYLINKTRNTDMERFEYIIKKTFIRCL